MRLTDSERIALVQYRIQKANDTWEETKDIVKGELWYAAANRMYYSCYYLTSALLISYGIEANTHAGVIRMLGKHFVATGLLSDDMGSFYSRLFELRQSGDYDDWKVITAKDVLPLYSQVDDYFQSLKGLIKPEFTPQKS